MLVQLTCRGLPNAEHFKACQQLLVRRHIYFRSSLDVCARTPSNRINLFKLPLFDVWFTKQWKGIAQVFQNLGNPRPAAKTVGKPVSSLCSTSSLDQSPCRSP